MKTNKLDNSIKDKFLNRTIEPSVSAWERMSVQLDAQKKIKKRGWFFYIGSAATVLLLVSIGIQLIDSYDDHIPVKNKIVFDEIDNKTLDAKLDKLKNEIPIEKVIVQNNEVEKEEIFKENIIIYQNSNIASKTEEILPKRIMNQKERILDVKLEEKSSNTISTKEKILLKSASQKSTIKINADDLLYSVTHNREEVEAYYVEHRLTRGDVLKAIRGKLKKMNLNVNPNIILAEVERTIIDTKFDNNFLKSLKKRITSIATAIASRNN